MIHLPDWADWLLIAASFGGAALLIDWGAARDLIASVRHGDDDEDLEGL